MLTGSGEAYIGPLAHPHSDHVDHAHWAFPPRPSCGAARPAIHDAGWECNGTGMVVVLTTKSSGQDLPVVLPRRALEIIDPESWWDLPVKDFAGGDHAHLVVPRRPVKQRTDTVLCFGSSAIPVSLATSRRSLCHDPRHMGVPVPGRPVRQAAAP